MTTGGKTWQSRLQRWLDQWRIAFSGIVLATRTRRFIVAFLLSFVIFGTLMNLLSGSSAALDLFWVSDIPGKLQIIANAFLTIFGIGRNFWDWVFTFVVVFLQSILIGLIALVWQHRRRSHKAQVVATATNADHLQNAGLAAGLAVLGTGCPTCGTSLLTPMLGAMFSTSGLAFAGFISSALTTAAVLITLFAIKRTGNDAYALIVSERYQKKHSTERKE